MPHQTALHGAAERGFTAFVKFLAENGADLQAKDANGRTAARSREGCRRPWCSPGSRRAVPGNRRPARIADGRKVKSGAKHQPEESESGEPEEDQRHVVARV